MGYICKISTFFQLIGQLIDATTISTEFKMHRVVNEGLIKIYFIEQVIYVVEAPTDELSLTVRE